MTSNLAAASMPPSYWVLRVLVFAEGLAILPTVVSSGGRVIDPSPYSASLQSALSAGAALLAISYILPNRWGIGSVAFWIRLTVMVAGAVRMFQMSILLANGTFGEKHSLLYPVLGGFLLGVLAAPVLLIWRRRRSTAGSLRPTQGQSVAVN